MSSEKITEQLSLSTLAPVRGARTGRVRRGRGESSGLGKTSGRGGKGQTARTGGTISPGFEGGQMPLYRRVSKYGFRSRQKTLGMNRFDTINVSDLESHFEAGAVVDAGVIRAKGFNRTGRNQAGLKVLGAGTISKKLTVKVNAISAAARSKIEAAGGKVEVLAVTTKRTIVR